MTMPTQDGFTSIKRRLITRLRQVDPRLLWELADDWGKNPGPSALLKRHFLVGLCGHWSQALDGAMHQELAAILRNNPRT